MGKEELKDEATRKADFHRGLYAFGLALGMLITGTCNTIFTKYQNFQSFLCDGYNCEPCPANTTVLLPNGTYTNLKCTPFEQPVFQTFVMFTGEFLCLFVFSIYLVSERRSSFKSDPNKISINTSTMTPSQNWLFVLPTCCDIVATTLMNLGLTFVAASTYQMLRGCVVIFTGILSVLFLRRKQYAFHWVAMFFVVAGVAVVGLVSIIFNDDQSPSSNPVVGDLLIILAQVFTATQFVIEEKFLGKYNIPPLQGVGMEGFFGVTILGILMPIIFFATGGADRAGFADYFDVKFAFEQFINFPTITVSSIGSVLSIAFFNFFGLTITKVMSATSRSTIDAMRTLLVWIVSLSLQWEEFIGYQVIGFVVLVFGTFMYNEVFHIPFFKPYLYPTAEQLELDNKARLEQDNNSDNEQQPLLDPDAKAKSIQVVPDDNDSD